MDLPVPLPGPWVAVTDPNGFEEQLRREVRRGHVLHGIRARAVARKEDDDDVLFHLLDGTDRVAVVHLTYSSGGDRTWPWTQVFADVQSWASTQW